MGDVAELVMSPIGKGGLHDEDIEDGQYIATTFNDRDTELMMYERCDPYLDTAHYIPKLRRTEMNTDHMVNALYKGLKAVQVGFLEKEGFVQKQYTYKTFDDYAIGDKCIVDSPSKGLVVVTVLGTDNSILEKDFRLKWIVQKIDTSNYESLVEKEDSAIEKLSQMIMEKRRIEAISEIEALIGGGKELLSISESLNGVIENDES